MLLRSSQRHGNVLRGVPLFSACSDAQLDRLMSLGTQVGVDAGQTVVAEGTYGNDFYVVLSGLADVRRRGTHIATLESGEWFGELSVLDGDRRDASVVMRSAGELFVISRRDFAALIETIPTVTRKLLVGMARRLHAADSVAEPATADAGVPEPRR